MAMAMMGARRAARKARWRGFSLFGVLLGLAVAGVVIVGAVALYNQTQEAAGRSEILTLLSQLKGAVERTYAGRAQYGAAGTSLIPVIDRRGGIPDNARVKPASGTVQIWHPFDDQVEVKAQVGEYTIKFLNLDDEICAALADVYVDQTRARTGLVSITFGSTKKTAPVTVKDVTDNCNAGAGLNDVTFQFG